MYDFSDQLQFSKGARCDRDIDTIMAILPGCIHVREASTELDKKGVDYVATLRGGAEVLIDAKTRAAGCSKYWRAHPELAIERWSVMPGGKYGTPDDRAKAGWSLDEAKITDMILYVWDVEDCETAFLIPFQTLRIATRQNCHKWFKRFKSDVQDSGSWQSEAVFVPAPEVIRALSRAQQFTIEAITQAA